MDDAKSGSNESSRGEKQAFAACAKKHILSTHNFCLRMMSISAAKTDIPLPLIEPNAIHIPLRDLLRAETQAVHERMHAHNGFAAVQNATIDRADYISLLCRLYGFYVPFEAAAAITPNRSQWLKSDLLAQNLSMDVLAAVPLCPDLPQFATPEQKLGALYVVEGAMLGGRALSGRLDGLLGPGVTAGRSFFSGFGAQTGFFWRKYLQQVANVPLEPDARANVISSAITTFALFETWLAGWETWQHEQR